MTLDRRTLVTNRINMLTNKIHPTANRINRLTTKIHLLKVHLNTNWINLM